MSRFLLPLGAIVAATLLSSAAARASETCWQALAAGDRDGDGKVSAAEAAGALDAAFGRLDADGDGAVSAKEHQACILDAGAHVGPASAPHRTQKRFAAIDADGDGQVSVDEYLAAGRRAYGEAAEGDVAAPLSRYASAMAEQGSGQPDADGDERVSEDEAARDVARSFALMDVDGDRRIARIEWATVTERPRFAASFDALDRNRDGRIGRPELFAAAPWAAVQSVGGQGGASVTVWRHAQALVLPDAETTRLARGGFGAAAAPRR